MKPILIIKTGNTLDSIRQDHGDFDDWIIKGTGKKRQAFLVAPVHEGAYLPQLNKISAAIITGSHDNITDKLPWMETIGQWLVEASQKQLPILGICFGHQLLAHALGGKVGFNPAGWELGYVSVYLKKIVREDILFSIFPSDVKTLVSHAQSVLDLPAGARSLARSSQEEHQAIHFGNYTWGVQFHPEFNCDITRSYITHHRNDLLSENQDPEELLSACRESKWGTVLLKQFVKIVENV